FVFFFSSRRRHTRFSRDWSSDVCSSDLDNKEFKFNWIAWANNDRIIMSLRYDSRWNNSITYTQTRLLATDAKKSSKMIALMKPGREQIGWQSQFQDSVISFLPDDPQHILLGVDCEMRR